MTEETRTIFFDFLLRDILSKKYSYAFYEKFLNEVREVCGMNGCYFGIAGSSIFMTYQPSMDFDFTLIVPDRHFNSVKFPLENCALRHWQYFLDIEDDDKVFGTFHTDNRANRIELYKESTAIKILSKVNLGITRIKKLPSRKTKEAFLSQHGELIYRDIKIESSIKSRTLSGFDVSKSSFRGMHFERLLLNNCLFDQLSFTEKILAARLRNQDRIKNQSFFCCLTQGKSIPRLINPN